MPIACTCSIGYPHDGRADNAAYRHDRRADNAAYQHDRRADSRVPMLLSKPNSRTFPGQMSNFQGLISTKFQDFSRIVKFITRNKKQFFLSETADLGNWEY